jgi:hypothetical protein
MDKPTEQTRIEKFFDYHECQDYINEKHNCDIRNFERSLNNGVGEYQDFWHHVVDYVEPARGCFFEMDDDWANPEYTQMEDWQLTIFNWFMDEFAEEVFTIDEDAKQFRSIRFWVDW